MPPEAAEAILGRQITDLQGKDLGRLVDILVDDGGQPQAAVIDFGGFLGVGNRRVALHWSALHFNPAEGKHIITLDMTPDQIKSAPEYTNMDKPAPVVTPTAVAAAPPVVAPAPVVSPPVSTPSTTAAPASMPAQTTAPAPVVPPAPSATPAPVSTAAPITSPAPATTPAETAPIAH